MLQATLIVMTVLGCGDQARSCDYIPGPAVLWSSQAECEAAISGVLEKSRDAPYPLITAECSRQQGVAQSTKAVSANSRQPLAGSADRIVVSSQAPDVAALHATQDTSIIKKAVDLTKSGLSSVRSGAGAAVDGIRFGASLTYGGISHGVRSSIDATATVTKRAVGALQARIGLELRN